MFLVTGITGKVGGAAARHLLAQGKKVRALVRDCTKMAKWADQSVELIDGEWNDGTAIARALEGIEGALAMVPPGWTPSPDFREFKEVVAGYTEAFAKSPPPRLVALSAMGAEKTDGIGAIRSLALMEQGFRGLPFPVVFIRAGGFYENFLYGLQAGQGGALPVFYEPTDRKSPMVASKDVGAEVAKLLTGPPWTATRVIELGSMVSPDEVAAQLGQVLKREVSAQSLPREAWAGMLEQMGFPHGQTWAFEEMFEALNSGWINFGVQGTERVAGTTSAREVFAAAHNG